MKKIKKSIEETAADKEAILAMLRTKSMTFGEIATEFNLEKYRVTNYLLSLRTFGLVTKEKGARNFSKYYATDSTLTYTECYVKAKNEAAQRAIAGQKSKSETAEISKYVTMKCHVNKYHTKPARKTKISAWAGYGSL